ncbi:TPA: DUF1080 domain-containing protein [bacterium]|nr:DUF1080 domain-containing protein [bacterium]
MKKSLLVFVIFAFLCVCQIFIQSTKALFFDFENEAQLKEWTVLGGTWTIVKDDITKSKVVKGEGANELILSIGDNSWTDYTVEFDGCGMTDDIGIAFRIKDLNNFYCFLIAPNLNLSEWFSKKAGAFDENIGKKSDNLGISINEWHKYKLVVEGTKARIFVDGKEPFVPVEISKDFNNGGIGLRQWGDTGHYDNVLITGPGIPRSPGEMAIAVKEKISQTWGYIKDKN